MSFVHLVALLAVFTATVNAKIMMITAPPLSGTFQSTWTQIIPSELTAMECVTAQDGPNRKYFQRCSTPRGSFTQLMRLDINMTYLYFDHIGAMSCYPSDMPYPPGPLPGPDFRSLPFIQELTLEGHNVNIFRIGVGRYYQSIMTDVKSGLPRFVGTGNMNDVHALYTNYSNGTVNDPSLFDIPAACNRSSFFDHSDQPMSQFSPSFADPGVVLFKNSERKHPAYHPAFREALDESTEAKRSASPFEPARDPSAWPKALQQRMFHEPFKSPKTLDNRKYYNPVRNQGLCGCCWSFGTSALMEAFVNIANNRTWVEDTEHWLAPQSLIDCVVVPNPQPGDLVPKACFGGDPLDAMRYISTHGIATEATYPFTSGVGAQCLLNASSVKRITPVSDAFLLPMNNVSAMKHAIALYGGILTAINDEYAWNYFSGHGIFDDPKCGPGFAHIITIVGYGEDESEGGKEYWLVKNSYGAGWGDAGYVKMALGKNMCGMETYPFAGVPSSSVNATELSL